MFLSIQILMFFQSIVLIQSVTVKEIITVPTMTCAITTMILKRRFLAEMVYVKMMTRQYVLSKIQMKMDMMMPVEMPALVLECVLEDQKTVKHAKHPLNVSQIIAQVLLPMMGTIPTLLHGALHQVEHQFTLFLPVNLQSLLRVCLRFLVVCIDSLLIQTDMRGSQMFNQPI